MARADFLEGFLRAYGSAVGLFCNCLQENLFKRSPGGNFRELLFENEPAVIDNYNPVTNLRDLGQDMG